AVDLDSNSQDDEGYRVEITSSNLIVITSDFGYRSDLATKPIRLASFNSQTGASIGSVHFEWTTESELGNVGFRIFAKTNDVWSSITDDLLPAVGDSTKLQSYQYDAQNLSAAQAFILIDVDLLGNQVLHGPFTLGQVHGTVEIAEKLASAISFNENGQLEVEQNKARSDVDHDARAKRKQREEDEFKRRLEQLMKPLSFNENAPTKHVSRTAMFSTLNLAAWLMNALVPSAHAATEFNIADFGVDKTGVYEVSANQLAASGVNIQGVASDNLQLRLKGEAVALDILDGGDGTFDSGDTMRFIGQGIETLYTHTNLYKLSLNQGGAAERVRHVQAGIPSGPSAPYYMARTVYNPQNTYALTSPSGDPWYAHRLLAYQSSKQKNIRLNVSHAVRANVSPILEVKLWGASDLPGDALQDPDHHVEILVNGGKTHDLRFDGVTAQVVNKHINNNLNNALDVTVKVPGDSGYIFDLVHIDSVSLDYPRAFVADGQQLNFKSSWPKFRAGGFDSTEVNVYAELEDGKTVMLDDALSGGNCTALTPNCEAMFGGLSGTNQYYLASSQGAYLPVINIPHLNQNITRYVKALVISHPDFIGLNDRALEQYVAKLSSEMGSAELIDVRSIYAEYSGGIVDANAIQQYISDANLRGTEQVLLVGGDTYDYHNYLGATAVSLIPSLYEHTSEIVRYSPVDPAYGDVDGDNVPDVVVARLPVQTAKQLRQLLNKREAYINRSYKGKAVFAADIRDEVEQYDYKRESNLAIARHFKGWNISRAYIDDLGAEQAKAAISKNINNGTSLVVYTGHSSKDRLSFHDLFDGDDAAQLSNHGQPTIVTQWGCWNNYNIEPTEISMADQFLLNGEQGAVAIIGASTLTNALTEKLLAELFYAEMANGKSIGRALLDAKRTLAVENPDAKDLLLGVSLMGFPELVAE
ncbi:MAG: C25 family cysteine peptidase, partial [Arenicellales bacterium]